MTPMLDNLSLCPAFGMPGPWEIVLILVVVLLLFGGKKLPELAKGLARGLKTFKTEMSDVRNSIEDAGNEPDKPSDKPSDPDSTSADKS